MGCQHAPGLGKRGSSRDLRKNPAEFLQNDLPYKQGVPRSNRGAPTRTVGWKSVRWLDFLSIQRHSVGPALLWVARQGRPDDSPTEGLKGLNEFIGECRLARGVYPIDRDANRVASLNTCDT